MSRCTALDTPTSPSHEQWLFIRKPRVQSAWDLQVCVTIWPIQVATQNTEAAQNGDGKEIRGVSLHSQLTVPGFVWPHSDSEVYTFCQARVTDPGWLSSSLPIADQEAADGVVIRKSVESFHRRGAFPSLGLLPSPSLILLQGSPMSHLSSPPASLAPASQHHQCLPTAHCMTPAREALRVTVHVLGPSPLPRVFLSAGGSSLGRCVAASLFITLH